MHTLYYAPDNASLIVRIVLEELEVPYETRLVDRGVGEQKSDAYRSLNPNGLIPVCIIDNRPVFETGAIVLSLAERHGSLAPGVGDAFRPQFLKWLFFLTNNVHADLRQMFYAEKFAGGDRETQEEHRRLTRKRVDRSFGILDGHYRTLKTPYILGSEISIVDVYGAVCLRWAQIYPMSAPGQISLAAYPALGKMVKMLEVRPAVVRSCRAEGIPAPFFSAPSYCNPPEGSAI